MAASAWAVGLRDDGCDLEIWLGVQVLECRDGKLWGAAEEDAQGFGSWLEYTLSW